MLEMHLMKANAATDLKVALLGMFVHVCLLQSVVDPVSLVFTAVVFLCWGALAEDLNGMNVVLQRCATAQ
jgi:hypothetical protein